MYSELFRPDDASLNVSEKELLRLFVERVRRKYTVSSELEDIRFQRIKLGFSPVTKLFSRSKYVFPYFIKLGDANEIERESRNYGIASQRIPPLNVPPLETYLQGTRLGKEHSSTSLIAFRYITGSDRTLPPLSLFYGYEEMSKYELVEVIDEIFQNVLRELHSFHTKKEILITKHLIHKIANFQNSEYPILLNLVKKYNHVARNARRLKFPHGKIHGDLHLENILLGRKASPVIIDFGMMYDRGCLIRDFAEFEVAMLVAALFNDFERTSIFAKMFYSSGGFLNNHGVDRFSRAAQTVRANLHVLSRSAPGYLLDITKLSYLYDIHLMRYICSYLLIVVETLGEEKKHAIVGYMTQIFETLHARVTKGD